MVFKRAADVIWLRSTTSLSQHIPFSVTRRRVRGPLPLLSLSLSCPPLLSLCHCSHFSRLLSGFSRLSFCTLSPPLLTLSLCLPPPFPPSLPPSPAILFLLLCDSVPKAEIGSVTHSISITTSAGKTFLFFIFCYLLTLHWNNNNNNKTNNYYNNKRLLACSAMSSNWFLHISGVSFLCLPSWIWSGAMICWKKGGWAAGCQVSCFYVWTHMWQALFY